MAKSRSSLIEILQKEFKNPTTKTQSLDHSKNILKDRPELVTRIFDKFPCLLLNDALAGLTKQFQTIFLQIKPQSVIETADGLRLDNEKNQVKIHQWEKEIINIAISELLDEKGHIKQELIEILEWQPFKRRLNNPDIVCGIICAYVGAINQEIIKKTSINFLEKDNKKFAALCDFVNKNYHDWIIDELDAYAASGCSPISKSDFRQKYIDEILRWPREKKSPGTLLLLAALGSAATICFFKGIHKNNLNADEMKFSVPKL